MAKQEIQHYQVWYGVEANYTVPVIDTVETALGRVRIKTYVDKNEAIKEADRRVGEYQNPYAAVVLVGGTETGFKNTTVYETSTNR